jgi:hypothetical protein
MNEALKKFFSTIISFGLPHYLPLATIVGSVLAVPLIVVWRLVYRMMPHVACGLLLTYVVVVLVALFIVVRLPHEEMPRFVADKVAGLFIAFTWIPLTIRIVFVGFCLFHAIRVLLPFVMKNFLSIDCERYGLFAATVIYMMLSGLAANGCLHIMQWTMQ